MYFNDSKENTNIDDQFKSNKKFNFDFSKYKIPIFIGGGILIFIILLIVILSLVRNNKSLYYIELLGNDVMTIYLGDTFNDPGYSAYDNKNNNLTNEVIVDNQVDTSMVGEYQVTYTLYNTIKTRYVNVTDKPVGATSLFLKGDINMYLEVGEKYTEPGYVVIDSIDGSLKDKVKINNNVDTSKAGTYKVIYSVVNSSGVTTSAIRTVIVLGSEISLNLSNESYTNKDVAINIYIADNYFDYLILPNGDKVTKNEYSYKVSENGTYTFTSYNKLGKKKEESIKVSNINKTSPTGSCSGSYKNGSSSVKINASDDIGISKYVVNGVTSTSSSVTLSSEVKTASVTIYDKAGNTKTITCNLTNNNSTSSSSKPSSSSSSSSNNKPLNITSGIKSYDGYQLYIPNNATTNMPLIVMLPSGTGDNGVINIIKNWKLSPINAFILFPSNPQNYTFILNTIDDLIKEYSINKKRVSASGFSSSGTYLYYLVAKKIEMFSAILSLSSGAQCDSSIIQNNLNYFKTVPMKGFGEKGGKFKSDGTKCAGWTDWSPKSNMEKFFICLGRSNDFTYLENKCHDEVRTYVLTLDENKDNKSDIFEWMISQEKK